MNSRADGNRYFSTGCAAFSSCFKRCGAGGVLAAILAVLLLGPANAPAANAVDSRAKRAAASADSGKADFSQRVGIYHWAGEKAHSMKDGVDRIAAFGGRVARVALAPSYLTDYNMGTGCYPNFSLEEAARIPDVEESLGHPSIRVVTITAYDGVSFGDCATHQYLNPDFYTAENFQAMVEEYTAFTLQLHRAYNGSGKTFILSNWEGDNAIYCGSAYRFIVDPEFQRLCEAEYPRAYGGNRSVTDSIAGMLQWLRVRRLGIEEGSRLAALEGLSGVEVRLAVEISMVRGLRSAGFLSVLYDVVPYAEFDLLSYSAYESTGDAEPVERLQADLDVIQSVAGERPLMLGEIGYSRASLGEETAARTHEVIVAALNWGVSYVIYWNLFDQSDEVAFGLFNLEGEPTLMSEYFSRQYLTVAYSARTTTLKQR